LPRPEREWADGGRPGQGLGSERHRSSERPSWPRQSPKCLGFRLGENAAKPVWARRGPRRLKSIAFDMCSGREWTPEARRLESGAKRKFQEIQQLKVGWTRMVRLYLMLVSPATPGLENPDVLFELLRVSAFCARVSSCTNALTERTGMHVSTLWANCFGGAVRSHGVDVPPDCSIAELSASETRFV